MTGSLFLIKDDDDYVIVLPTACDYPARMGFRVTSFTADGDAVDERVLWSATVDNAPVRLRVPIGTASLPDAKALEFNGFGDATAVSIGAFVPGTGPAWDNVFTLQDVTAQLNGGDRLTGAVTANTLDADDNCPG